VKRLDTQNLDLEEIQKNSAKAADLLKTMSNQHRLLILCHLGDGELSVSQLNERVLLSQSSLSQHLAKLRQEGIVETRRESQTIYYRIATPVAMDIIGLLYENFCKQ